MQFILNIAPWFPACFALNSVLLPSPWYQTKNEWKLEIFLQQVSERIILKRIGVGEIEPLQGVVQISPP